MRSTLLIQHAALILLLALAPLRAHAEAPPPPPPSPAPDVRAELTVLPPTATPLQLFAAVEESWIAGNAGVLASLVDTTQVRIGLKPGSTPTAAVTRSAAEFLFQDQLRLVTTQSFQVLRVNVGNGTASATARWFGNWGGREGIRRLTVTLNAVPVGGRWWLREVRVKG